MGRKTRLVQTENTAKEEMETSLANREKEEDGDSRTAASWKSAGSLWASRAYWKRDTELRS